MGATLAHRGPDDSGTYHDPKKGIGLAFRRLSVVDLSPCGNQPMASVSGRYVIIFNGEVYNFDDIRAELGISHWRGHSDTEVILEAMERWGLDAALQRFVGMFAFALWDRQDATLHLVRDRLGIKPLYYGRVNGDFVFASELKAIRQYPEFSGEISRDALSLYMRLACVPSHFCIYKHLHKLPPGHRLSLSSAAAAPELHQYWSASEAARTGAQTPFAGSDAEAIEQLEEKLLVAVRLRMIADVPLGAFLSGGVDSSLVVALMQSHSGRPVKTFTIGFQEDGYNEAAHARQVAAHLGTEHTEIYGTSKDALDVVPLLPAMYDEPFADSSQLPTYILSKMARDKVTVSLSGDGGDELFGGYNRYIFTRRLWNAIRRSPKFGPRTMARMIRSISPGRVDRVFQMLRSVTPKSARLPAPGDKLHKLANFASAEAWSEIYLRAVSYWDDPSEIVVNSSEPATMRDSITQASWLPNLEESMMLTDLQNYLPDDILTKVDRASMAVSLEARVPLLDHRLVEFAWTLPLRFKIRQGTGKWILRQVLNKYVPAKLVARPKMGFSVPIDSWLRGPLRDWAESLLSADRLGQHGLLNVDAIRVKWQEHLSGARNRQDLLWVVLVFQDWYFQTDHCGKRSAPVERSPGC